MVKIIKGGITATPGFIAAGVRAGMKRRGPDLMLLVNKDGPTPAAGMFTSNLVRGAPIPVTKNHLRNGKLAAIVVNAGCANAYTGKQGLANAHKMAELTAKQLGLKTDDIGVASTGMIGTQLKMDRIERGIKKATKRLSASRAAGKKAAKSILTTDTRTKEFAVKVKLEDGKTVTIGGAAKGSGMIKPKLQATMLVFLTTDANISPPALKSALKKSVDSSFNMLTVDEDTSTSDTILVLANGLAGNKQITLAKPSKQFQTGLDFVTTELTRMIARDGEGAKHLIEVRITSARNKKDARKAAIATAGSNLVKAAVFGQDPNWGRIVTALGYSGAKFNPDRVTLCLATGKKKVTLITRGKVGPASVMKRAAKILKAKEVKIIADLAAGSSAATAWGCDLTYGYVEINAKYTT